MKQYWMAQDLRKQQSRFASFRIECGLVLIVLPVVFYLIGHAIVTAIVNATLLLLTVSGILLLMGSALELRKIRETRIVLTDETITFISLGTELQTTWKKVMRIRNLTNPVYESLWLAEPVMPKSAWWAKLLSLGQPKQEIPLAIFDWRNTGLEQEIRKHTPHLFIVDTISV